MAEQECKYKTYAELAQAFRSGELDKETVVLVLDNDSCRLASRAQAPDGLSETLADQWYEEQDEKLKTLFHGHGYDDLEDAVKAAGIPCEWC